MGFWVVYQMDKYVSDQPAINAKQRLFTHPLWRLKQDFPKQRWWLSAKVYDFTTGEAEILIFLYMRTQYLSSDMCSIFMLAIQSNLDRQVQIPLNIFLRMIYLTTLLLY
jgi:hypothetical protein